MEGMKNKHAQESILQQLMKEIFAYLNIKHYPVMCAQQQQSNIGETYIRQWLKNTIHTCARGIRGRVYSIPFLSKSRDSLRPYIRLDLEVVSYCTFPAVCTLHKMQPHMHKKGGLGWYNGVTLPIPHMFQHCFFRQAAASQK